jgi:pimeloyl-ACP methyl ester carboxylesterase
MSLLIDVLWVSVSPALQRFHKRLLRELSQHQTIACWDYVQCLDESMSLDTAVETLHSYVQLQPQPIHLIGHSTGGLVALLYARRYPERVRSLTLLSVGFHPAMDWQAQFYTLLQLLPCGRETILTQMVGSLFGLQPHYGVKKLVETLEADLCNSLSPHTLWQRVDVPPGGAPIPILICGSDADRIIAPPLIQSWNVWLKEGDRLWQCPNGRHFFHYFQPTLVGEQILNFWLSIGANQTDSVASVQSMEVL